MHAGTKTDTLKAMRRVNSSMRLAVWKIDETQKGESIPTENGPRYKVTTLTNGERAANAADAIRLMMGARSRLDIAIREAEALQRRYANLAKNEE